MTTTWRDAETMTTQEILVEALGLVAELGKRAKAVDRPPEPPDTHQE
jgi:hypothetical protein